MYPRRSMLAYIIVLVMALLGIVVILQGCAAPVAPSATVFSYVYNVVRYDDSINGVSCYYIKEVPETFQCLDTRP